jgi:hypothetical protein
MSNTILLVNYAGLADRPDDLLELLVPDLPVLVLLLVLVLLPVLLSS